MAAAVGVATAQSSRPQGGLIALHSTRPALVAGRRSCKLQVRGTHIPEFAEQSCRILSGLALRQPPSGSDKMAGVAVGIAFEIVLMFRLRFPEVADRRDFGGRLSRPNSRRIDI